MPLWQLKEFKHVITPKPIPHTPSGNPSKFAYHGDGCSQIYPSHNPDSLYSAKLWPLH